jgi:hypothetical protein
MLFPSHLQNYAIFVLATMPRASEVASYLDYPGESSLPPGISNLQAPSELRSYLLRLGIAYVLFEPNMVSISEYEARLASPTETYLAGPWDYNEMIVSMRTHQNIARLGETSEVQSSNDYEVIKLASP